MKQRCIYCGKKLTSNEELEHIIPNALSGMLYSSQICCSECNSLLGKTVDMAFNKLFAPILKSTYYFYKYNNSKKWAGDNIDTKIKANELDNNDFFQGLSKIAVEYATYKNIDSEVIQENFTTTYNADGTAKRITYSSKIIPFYPMNCFDKYLEFDAPFYLNHKLILFSHQNYLVCYIDLYSTFQYYVVLSEQWDSSSNVYEFYVQEVRLFDSSGYSTSGYSTFSDLKDLQIILMEHRLWPDPEQKIIEVIRNTSLEKEFKQKKALGKNWFEILSDNNFFSKILEIIDKKFYYNSLHLHQVVERQICTLYSENCLHLMESGVSIEELTSFCAIQYYLDDNDELKPNIFRRYSPQYINNYHNIYFYPDLCSKVNVGEYQEYQNRKINMLTDFLNK